MADAANKVSGFGRSIYQVRPGPAAALVLLSVNLHPYVVCHRQAALFPTIRLAR
jgi:hypothetical protein